MTELSEREKAAIWDHIDSGTRDLTIGPREKAVIGCTCRRPFRDPFDYRRDHHEPGCRSGEAEAVR